MSVVDRIFEFMEEVVRYKYRLRPGALATEALNAEWNRCRFLWNECVFQSRNGTGVTFGSLCLQLTQMRRDNSWMREGSQVAQQQMLRTFALALWHSLTVKRRKRPAYKARKKALASLEFSVRGFSVRDGRLILPKGISIPVVWSRELPSEPSSVRVFCDSLGHWYASFVVHRESEPVTDATAGIGIDWGVSTTASASDAKFDLPYLGHRKRCAADLAKAQRSMARRHARGTPTRGYKRARLAAAKLQKKGARQNQHDSRVWAKQVVAHHQLIAVEDFKPAFLSRSTMARKSADAAIGAAKRELIESATRAGRKVVMVKPAYTTMTCSSCFARAKQRLELSQRTFLCQVCGHTDSRDRNAARVILAVAERGHTRVEDVRHLEPPPSRLRMQSEREIPRL